MGAKPIHETQAKKSAFTGTGYKLGETADPSEVVAAPQATASMIPDDNKPLPVCTQSPFAQYTVFMVSRSLLPFGKMDSQLRSVKMQTLQRSAKATSLKMHSSWRTSRQGRSLTVDSTRLTVCSVVPEELRHHNRPIGLKLEDHRDQDYVPRKKKLKSFSGTGHKLGSPTPQVLAASSAASAAPAEAKQLEIKDDQPTTKLQIRLSDGTRLFSS